MKKLMVILYAFSLFFKTIICSDSPKAKSKRSREMYGLQHLVEHLATASGSNSEKNMAFISGPEISPEDLVDIGITHLLRIQRSNAKTLKRQNSREVVIKFPKVKRNLTLK